jgi:hypothetical protein
MMVGILVGDTSHRRVLLLYRTGLTFLGREYIIPGLGELSNQ